MNDEHMDETFRELQAELTISPSPEFAARVRANVAVSPARGWFPGWRFAAAAVTVAVGGVIGAVMWAGGRVVPAVAPPPAVARVEPAPAAVAETPAPAAIAPVRRARAATRLATRVPVRAEPEVIVSPDDRIALTRLLVAIREGRAVVPAAENLMDETTGDLRPLAAIEPLEVKPLSTAATGGGSGRRE